MAQEVTVINGGVSGDTTAGGLSRLDWSLTPEVKALIVNLGGNDLLRGIDPADVARQSGGDSGGGQGQRACRCCWWRRTRRAITVPTTRRPSTRSIPILPRQYGAILSETYFLPLIDPATGMPKPEYDAARWHSPQREGVALILDALGPKVLDLLAEVRGS